MEKNQSLIFKHYFYDKFRDKHKYEDTFILSMKLSLWLTILLFHLSWYLNYNFSLNKWYNTNDQNGKQVTSWEFSEETSIVSYEVLQNDHKIRSNVHISLKNGRIEAFFFF